MNRRIFIAINLPEEIKKKLIDSQEEIKKLFAFLERNDFNLNIFRWTKKENLHITLAFLGYIRNEQLPEIIEITKKIAQKYKPFSVSLEKIIYGPNNKMPKMIWVKAKKNNELSKIKEDLEKNLSQKVPDFEKESRNFSPHITLARIKQWAFKQIEPEERPEVFKEISFNFKVNSVEIMESRLNPRGPDYFILESIPLEKK